MQIGAYFQTEGDEALHLLDVGSSEGPKTARGAGRTTPLGPLTTSIIEDAGEGEASPFSRASDAPQRREMRSTRNLDRGKR